MIRSGVLAAAMLLATSIPIGQAQAGDGLGPYVRGGVAFGWANVDDAVAQALVGGTVSNGVNVGFDAAFGWRFMSALAAEAEIVFITGGEGQFNGVTVPGVETQAVSFTVNGKLYPLMFGSDDANGLLQPYVVVGVGGGSGEIKGALAGALGGSEGTFLARFGGGLDMMFGERFGIYADGAYYMTTKDGINGTGVVSAGGILRF